MGNTYQGIQAVLELVQNGRLDVLLFSVLPPKKRHELSHRQNDLIIACTFYGLPCDDTFKLLLSPEFLNCYTFTGFKTKTYPVGVENGLSLILKEDEISLSVGHYSDTSNIWSTKGLRITVHEPYTIPNLFDNSMELVPGHSTTVSIQQKNIERINTPKSKCIPKTWIHQKSNTDRGFRSTYYSCLLQCDINYVWERCGCKPAVMPDLFPFEEEEEHLQCTFSNKSDKLSLQEMLLKMHCEFKRMKELNTIKEAEIHPPCVEVCDWDCNSIEYSTDVSQSRWPVNSEVPNFLYKYVSGKFNQINKDYHKHLIYAYNGSFDQHYNQDDIFTFNEAVQITKKIYHPFENATEIANELMTKMRNKTIIPSINPQHLNLSSVEEAEIKWVQDSFYRVNIYFKEPVVQVHRQLLDYGLADFWSALGGILGLWAGISIITVIELFEFLCRLFKITSEKACRLRYSSQR